MAGITSHSSQASTLPQYTCYLIDVSPSMGKPLGADLDPVHGASKSRLSYALDSVRIRIAQRIMNPKATDQIAIVTFGDDKTANMLADREGYDNIVEVSQMHQPSFADLSRLNDIEVGTANVDLVSALYVAGEIVRQAKVARKDAKKQIILFTDAEEPMGKNDDGDDAVSTAWKETSWMEPLYTALVPGMDGAGIDPKMHFTLTIVGTDFGDPEMDLERRKNWSKAKQWNVDGLMALFQRANELGARHRAKMPRVSTAPVQGYIALARQPSVPVVATTSKLLPLHIGDPDKFPDESLTMQISLQKAAQKAASKSLGKMRRGAWTKTLSNKKGSASDSKGKKRARDYSDDEDEEDEDDEDRATFHQPGELAQDKVGSKQSRIMTAWLNLLAPRNGTTCLSTSAPERKTLVPAARMARHARMQQRTAMKTRATRKMPPIKQKETRHLAGSRRPRT